MNHVTTSQVPLTARHRMSWGEFPPGNKPETFLVTSPAGDIREITLSKGSLRVFKGLIQSPIYAASLVRISDRVLILKRDHGLNIETMMFDGEDGGRFGIYVLRDQVQQSEQVAA